MAIELSGNISTNNELVLTGDISTENNINLSGDITGNIVLGWVKWGNIKGTLSDQTDLQDELTQINDNISTHVNDKNNPHEVTKSQVGLSNVDNTSDINKPVSTATQTALNLKANASDVYNKSQVDVKDNNVLNSAKAYTNAYHDDTKVDKVSGKGLSANDYTNSDKSLVGSALQPNDNVSKLVNDAGYLTQHQSLSNYYTKSETDTNINNHHDATKQNVIDSSNKLNADYVASGTTNKVVTQSEKDTWNSKEPGDATILKQANVVNNTSTTTTNMPLSANMGKELQDQINNLKARGRYLSVWNCTTGLAETEPTVNPYTYKTGDFFIVGTVGTTNYKPNGATYDKTVPSTTVESGDVKVNDTYYYDGTAWGLLHTETPIVAFSTLAGSPYDNTNLANALNSKQATIDSSNKLSADLISDGTTNKTVTQSEKNTWNSKQPAGNYMTLDTDQTATSKKTFSYTEPIELGGQETILNVLSTHEDADMSAMWAGRMKIGNRNKTFLLGVYKGNVVGTRPICGMGAHSWDDSFEEEGAAWEDIYLEPDGDKAVYIGGHNWVPDTGWFKVQNNATDYNGKVYCNRGSITGPEWREVATISNSSTTATNETWSASKLNTQFGLKESTSNKVTSISSSSTNTQYPSAKVVYDNLQTKQNTIDSTHKLSSDLVDDTDHANKFVTAEEKVAIAGISEKEWAGNKTSTINSESTTTEYTSAYGVYHYHDATKQNVIDSSNKLNADYINNGDTNKVVTQTEKDTWDAKSVVSVASTGTSTDMVGYITINGTEKKLAGGSQVIWRTY